VSQLQEENAALRQRVEEMSKETQANKAEAEALQSELAQLQEQLKAAKAQAGRRRLISDFDALAPDLSAKTPSRMNQKEQDTTDLRISDNIMLLASRADPAIYLQEELVRVRTDQPVPSDAFFTHLLTWCKSRS